jgi:hypothetical protein
VSDSQAAGRPIKRDLPLDSDDAVRALVAGFESCTLPYAHWTHRAHLAVAATYLADADPEAALARLRAGIQRYNRLCGDPAGYNETVTRLYVRRIAATLADVTRLPLHARIARLAAAYPLGWMYAFFSRERIWSDAAKRGWIEPDLRPLDF